MNTTRPAGTSPALRDSNIRAALAATIATRCAGHPHVLVPEVEIRWSVPARMDALLISDRINGFEIKSDVDSLARLPRQVQAYGALLERAHLVVGTRHHEAAAALVPPWWAVWTAARTSADTVTIRQVRRGRLNPDLSPLAVTSLLVRADLTRALREAGESRLSGTAVDDLRALLLRRLGPARTVQVARTALLARTDLRARAISSS